MIPEESPGKWSKIAACHEHVAVDMSKTSVSVVIDTYNYGRYVEEAVDSVLGQDYPVEQREVIVVDDGSTDDTPKRVRKYGDAVKYLRKENGGQASAFNYGLERARGEIVAFLDSDDYWLPGKLKRVMEGFEQNPEVGMVYHNFYELDAEGRLRGGGLGGVSGFLPASRKALLGYDVHATSTLAFRRSVMDRLLPVPEAFRVGADAHFSACAIFLAPVIYVAEPLSVYRIHSDNLYHSGGERGAEERLRRRIKTTRAIGEDVRQWLVRNGFDVSRSEIRAYLTQWTISSRADEFALLPPGRVRFFRHLLEQGRYFGCRMGWRHKIVFYANATGSLVVGYKGYPRLEQWRIAAKRALGFDRR
jgi:glycosyltransferase involved in cell wall biosynthesis